jgi:hypothetical protein
VEAERWTRLDAAIRVAADNIGFSACGRPGAARNLVDHFRRRRSRVDGHHTLGEALAAFRAALLPASADSLNGKWRKTPAKSRRRSCGKESISV